MTDHPEGPECLSSPDDGGDDGECLSSFDDEDGECLSNLGGDDGEDGECLSTFDREDEECLSDTADTAGTAHSALGDGKCLSRCGGKGKCGGKGGKYGRKGRRGRKCLSRIGRAGAVAACGAALAWVGGCGPAEGQAAVTAAAAATAEGDGVAQGSTGGGLESAARPLTSTPGRSAPAAAGETPAAVPAFIKQRVDAKIAELRAQHSALASVEQTVQGQIERYTARTRRSWSPGDDPGRAWQRLLDQRYLVRAPANPFSPDRVATHVVVVSEPGVDGDDISPEEAGWVWNAVDGKLYAARDSAAIRAVERDEVRRVRSERAMPLIGPRIRPLRAQIGFYIAYEGQSPWPPGTMTSRQWKPLIERGYIPHAPVNPMAPREVSTLVIEVARPGETGTAVDPERAGWVWNSADQKLYAAGFGDEL